MDNKNKINLSGRSARGKFYTDKLPHQKIRTHCISVRLNEEEMNILNDKRGEYKKGEWLRMASLNVLPPVLPELNREAWVMLGKLAQELNQLLAHLDKKQPDSELTRTELFAVRRQIKALREHLIPSAFLRNDE
ncbi:ATP-binding protein [Escherichia coli]|uniref:ATP-binding protein n=1 Tax=Escherichia coli TaxID=562 RepID=UPI000E34EF77|nr:ATP-binding protein [Escherichia coli]EEV3841280.1 ATP-binding protein [Escherichia coli]EEX2797991.1 ATP-binding protein [Escherichia coli]EEZ5336204.1 ATP-binding protein [Escherichia coli]EFL6174279.1 ATP-binding protein [Escherichia coli]EFU6057337.1 ATP-binding protein [Escherichia coli]